eukprot:CAMPEP_0171138412 /NCGR_PEP_ID=MMETSP0766_2-20121228/135055_1 /TAXON_ID=439317 /ORGANISM="Gambierdiscus australes, Strain CAWD 149" /LENGTH=156 /DNA_ID=CAMNT_0011602025 /DNA_START=28 /DNA_END=494 /DNA_ORIENTATION=-
MSVSAQLPVFDIDLEQKPSARWCVVANAYAAQLQSIAQWQQNLADSAMGPRSGRKRSKRSRRAKVQNAEERITRYVAVEAARLLEDMREAGGAIEDMVEELEGVAVAAGVDLHALAMLSLQYEAYCACTAMLVPTKEGSVALARTLDWEFPELKAL